MVCPRSMEGQKYEVWRVRNMEDQKYGESEIWRVSSMEGQEYEGSEV